MPELRVCSWNVQMGQRLEDVVRTVQSESDFKGVAVLALQEASEHDGVLDAAAIAHALGSAYRYHQVTAQEIVSRPQANALVWSERRISEPRTGSLSLPRLSDLSEIPRAERWLLRALPRQSRGAVWLQGRFGDATVRVYGVHADVVGFEHRRRQLRAVLDHDSSLEPTDLVVLAADLNTFGIRARPSWRRLHAAIADAGFRDVTRDVGWTQTLRRIPLRQKLDAVLVKGRVDATARAWTVLSDASDHMPLFVELSWR